MSEVDNSVGHFRDRVRERDLDRLRPEAEHGLIRLGWASRIVVEGRFGPSAPSAKVR